jgi:hypothetical protein
MNYSVLCGINNPNLFFHSNQSVYPRKLSRKQCSIINHVSESPQIKEEEKFLDEHLGGNHDT